MIFRQLFEAESSTYTDLICGPHTREAILLDPVVKTIDRDLSVFQDLEFTLACTLDTHVHADHITCGDDTERAVRQIDSQSFQGAPISRP